jgi:hypothetical protein
MKPCHSWLLRSKHAIGNSERLKIESGDEVTNILYCPNCRAISGFPEGETFLEGVQYLQWFAFGVVMLLMFIGPAGDKSFKDIGYFYVIAVSIVPMYFPYWFFKFQLELIDATEKDFSG